MRLSKNDGKMGVALAVLRHVKLKRNDVSIDAYSNCREQGLYLISFLDINVKWDERRACSFSENRNSDCIIVQYGIRKDFNDYGVFKEDDKYQSNKKHFKPDEHEQAGLFVQEWLNGDSE